MLALNHPQNRPSLLIKSHIHHIAAVVVMVGVGVMEFLANRISESIGKALDNYKLSGVYDRNANYVQWGEQVETLAKKQLFN